MISETGRKKFLVQNIQEEDFARKRSGSPESEAEILKKNRGKPKGLVEKLNAVIFPRRERTAGKCKQQKPHIDWQ